MHTTGSLKQLELQAKQYASSQAADQSYTAQPPPLTLTQPEYLSGTWQGQLPQPPGQFTGRPVSVVPGVAQPSVLLPPASLPLISSRQQEPTTAQNMGMHSGTLNNPAVSFGLPVPNRPAEPCSNYFSPPQQLRPCSTDIIRPASRGTYFPPVQTRPRGPDIQPNQIEHRDAVTRPPQPTPPRNVGPLVFMPSRRPSVEASITRDTSFGVKRGGRGFPSARNIRSSRSAGSWHSFRDQRTASSESYYSGFGETMDEGWNTTSYSNESSGGKTTQGFVSPSPSAVATGNQVIRPWHSYDQSSQNQRGPAMQKDCVSRLMDLASQPSRGFSSKYCVVLHIISK